MPVSPGACAALVCDRAGWHQHGEKLEPPDNIVLLHLPPYAPELNPMENVWASLRANKLCVLEWDSDEAILEACKNAWHFPINDPDRIRLIGTREWETVNVWGGWYYTEPERRQALVLQRLTINFLSQPPPKITSDCVSLPQ